MNRKQRRMEQKRGLPMTQAGPSRVQEMFSDALRRYRAGRLLEAERLCRRIQQLDPRHSDNLRLLEVILQRKVVHDGGAGESNADIAIGHYNAGLQLQTQNRLDEAVARYHNAITLKPDFPEAHDNLGNCLWAQGRLADAVASYLRAISLRPDQAGAYSNLGNALQAQGRLDDAALCYRRTLRLRPDHPGALGNLGNALREQGRLIEAIVCCRNVISLKPDHSQGYNSLGNTLEDQGHLSEAADCYRKAIDLMPDDPVTHNNLGNALREQGRLNEAVACYGKAIDLKPDYSPGYNNLGNALQDQGRLDEAMACYRKAIDFTPDHPGAHRNLAMALLACGELAAGWREYEWRWKTPEGIVLHRDFAQPQWRGEPMEGKTLLIHAEQGFGDSLQFCRYAPLVAERGARVVMEVQKPLVRLMRKLSGVDLVVGQGEELPPFDFHCPMLSMPLALQTTLATIPATVPYLRAACSQVSLWRERLAALLDPGPRIGLVWAGGLHAADRRRSMAPEQLASLFDLSGLHFFSLQKGGPAAPHNVPLIDVMAEMDDFADTAALIANLDLVISVDTAVAHLAAAQGKPVWLLDRFDADWRWLRGREDSPWYPTLRLFRQPEPGHWQSVIETVKGDLARFVTDFRLPSGCSVA